VSLETKQEAEKLRNEAEQAEIDMASAASVKDQRDLQERADRETNGFNDNQPSYDYGYDDVGKDKSNQYGNSNVQLNSHNGLSYGYGGMAQPSLDNSQNIYGNMGSHSGDGGYDSGFAAGVMGGGGDRFELPPPEEFSNVQYSSPF